MSSARARLVYRGSSVTSRTTCTQSGRPGAASAPGSSISRKARSDQKGKQSTSRVRPFQGMHHRVFSITRRAGSARSSRESG